MKKTTAKLLLPLGLAAIIPTAFAQSNGEEYYSVPLRTFTFDSQPYNLASWQRAKSNIVFKNGGTEGRLGSKCLLVDCSNTQGNTYGTYISNIPCTPSQKVLVTVWCKVTPDFPEKATAGLEVEFYNANKKQIPTGKAVVNLPVDKRNGDWQRLAVTTEAPAGTATMRICLPVRNASAGKVWFDDLTMSAMPNNFDPAVEAKYTEVIHETNLDEKIKNWPSWQTPGGGVVFSHSNPGGRNDSKCLAMDFKNAKKAASGIYLNVFPCQPGKKYMFSAWFKASKEVKSETLISMSVVFLDGSRKVVKTPAQEIYYNVINNENWQRLVFFFEAPENIANMRVHFTSRHTTPGKILLDDIAVKAMP